MQTIRMDDMVAAQIVEDDAICVELGHKPKRYYRHGWQSWSLAAWTDAAKPVPTLFPYLLHPMQIDPVYAFHRRPHGSWVGAVNMEDGQVILLGSLGVDAHVELDGTRLIGRYEAGKGTWFIAKGDEMGVFSAYAGELGPILGQPTQKPVGGVWCSWYSLYTAIDERRLARVFEGLGDLPFEVLQVDDGWQKSVGDWEANDKFPAGMQALAKKIKATGRRAGIWLAPLIAVRSSQLFREHRDWFLRDAGGRLVSAGFNWGEQVYALDTTHPEVIEWLRLLMQGVRAWGYDYLKLDFLYAGALPGKRLEDLPREAAYRRCMQVLRKAMGEDAYFLACGAPIVPSLGLCDALRIGSDVAAHWESERDAVLLRNPAIPGTRNAIRTTMNRLWLKPLVQLDPDVAYFGSADCSLSNEQKSLLQSLALICGFRATSDLPQMLTEAEREALRKFLRANPRIEQMGARRFKIDGQELDYSAAMELAKAPAGWTAVKSAAFGWLANHRWALRRDYVQGKRAVEGRLRKMEGGT